MIRNLARDQQGFTSNVFLLDGDRTALVDVGNEFDVVGAIDEHVDTLDAVVLTHTHPDHIGNLDAVRSAFDVDVWGYDPEFDGVDHALADEDTLDLGDHEYLALHTPGHKNDHVCLYAAAASRLFAGDLIFANGGFGRTDLDEGDRDTLIRSIEYVRDTVGDDLQELYAGHGPAVTSDASHDIELALQASRMR